jgi:hypothetical protein
MSEWIHAFTGSQREYDPLARSGFQNAEIVAVTSYNALFNTNPFFDEPQVIIFDDAHAAENYLIGFWTLSVQRNEHQALFQALVGVLQQVELKDPGLQGYRALWNYLAGCAASKMARDGVAAQQAIAREYYTFAARAMPGIPWLRDLAGAEREAGTAAAQPGQSAAILVERLEGVLDRLGTMHDQRFAAFEKEILEGLASSDPPIFEKAHEGLGTLLGFEAGNEESKGSPDPWWLVDKSLCLIFEDHSDAQPDSKLSVKKARQVALHPNWIRERLELAEDARVLPVLVTPVSAAEDEAAIHLKEVAVWPIEQFRVWAVNAVQMVRQLRVTYPGAGDMFWRQIAMEAYDQASVDPESLLRRLQPQSGRAEFT